LAIIAGMTTDVTGFIACDCAADRVPLSGGVCAGVCDPALDECQEAVQAIGGQRAERDFRPQAGQV
jgi:hypothetical protein